MSGMPRRELEEVVFLYEREPSLRDIYVEGAYDASIVRWFLAEQNLKNVNIYEISDIEIKKEVLFNLGRKSNNRERVIYLAEYLNENLPDSIQFICVADRDFDHFINVLGEVPSLLITDFTCMEMYFFSQRVLERFFILICNKAGLQCNAIFDSLSNVIQEFFLMRLANEHLQWEMSWLNDIVCIEENNWELALNSEEFTNRLLNKNGRMNQKDEFKAVVETFRESLHDEVRFQMHGHDYINILCWLLHQKGLSRTNINKRNLPRILATSITISELLEYDLFSSLANRLTAS